MRILCFIALLSASTFSVQAQSVKKHRVELVAAGAISPANIFKRFDAITVPERDSVEFAAQLLSESFRLPNTQLETVSCADLVG